MVFSISIKSVSKSLFLTMALLLTSTPLFPTVVVTASFQLLQIGADIDGEAGGDQFGRSVSMSGDGNTFVVGATGNDGNGGFSGHVRVYKFNSTFQTYVQLGPDIDGEAAGDFFGGSVSMSADGTTFVVGAQFNNGFSGSDTGHVRVYKFNSTTNTFAQFGVDIDGAASRDSLGASVSISADGTTFVVGAVNNDKVTGSDSGHVQVYKFNSTINTYAQVGLDIDGEVAGDFFGRSVSMSGDGTTFVVGATLNDGVNGTDTGHVRVYKFNSTINTYVQFGFDIDGEAAGDGFGISVSMSGDGTTFVVGATGNDGINRGNSGHVRVYKFNATLNTYTQVGLDIDGEAANDEFGFSVSISADGTTFVVGARSNSGVNGIFSGHVRVYKLNSAINTYVQFGLDVDGEAAFDVFGTSVSMSADGTTFVVGAIGNDGSARISLNFGHVRVFSTSIVRPTNTPTKIPTTQPTKDPTNTPTKVLTKSPTKTPTTQPTQVPTTTPTRQPTQVPTKTPTKVPTESPTTKNPTMQPTKSPTKNPTRQPTKSPTKNPTKQPTKSPTTNPTRQPTKSPTTQPIIAPTISCNVTWKLFNSHTDSLIANLLNGTIVTTPPPCRRTNIEAVVPCGDLNNEVTIELFRNSNRVHRRVERLVPYFLFGDNGGNIYNGRIAPGTYRIRASVNDVFTPFTTFTLQGPKCY